MMPIWSADATHSRINRWHCLFAACIVDACGGTVYITNLYLDAPELQKKWFAGSESAALKSESLVFAAQFGTWLPFAGFFFDSRFGGPQRTILVGAVLTLLGYGGIWLCSVGGFDAPFPVLWMFFWLWGHGAGYFDCTTVVTVAHTFHRHRGRALGVVKAFFGLSGSILTQVYQACFAKEGATAYFLLFMGTALPGLALGLSPLLRRRQFTLEMEVDRPLLRLSIGAACVLVLALTLTGIDLLRSFTAMGEAPAREPFNVGALVVTIAGLVPLAFLGYAGDVPLSQPLLHQHTATSEEGEGGGGAHGSGGHSCTSQGSVRHGSTTADADVPSGSAGAVINASSAPPEATEMPQRAGQQLGLPLGSCSSTSVEAGVSAGEDSVLTTLRRPNFWLMFFAVRRLALCACLLSAPLAVCARCCALPPPSYHPYCHHTSPTMSFPPILPATDVCDPCALRSSLRAPVAA